MKKVAAACAAILVGAALAAPAAAENVRISTHGVAVESLHARIVRTAESLCRDQRVRGVHDQEDLAQCVRDTVDDAIARSRHRALQAFHQALPAQARYSAQQTAALQ